MKNTPRSTLFLVVTSIFWFSLYTYVPNLTAYSEKLGASPQLLGLIIGSYGFTQMLLRIPLGLASDGLRKRRLFVTLGMACAFVSNVGCILFANPMALLIFRSMAGMAAASWVAFTVLFASYYPEQTSGGAIGTLMTANLIGNVAATTVGGALANNFGDLAPYVLAAVTSLIGLCLSFLLTEVTPQLSSLSLRARLAAGLEKQLLLVSIIAIFLQMIVYSTVFGFTPKIAREVLQASPLHVGLFTTTYSVCAIVTSRLSGTLSQRLGSNRLLVVAFLGVGVVCCLLPFCKTIVMMYVLQAMQGLFAGVLMPTMMTLSIQNASPDKRGVAMGFFQSIYGLGMFVGPAMAGFIISAFPLTTVFFVACGVAILASIVAGTTLTQQVRMNRQAQG